MNVLIDGVSVGWGDFRSMMANPNNIDSIIDSKKINYYSPEFDKYGRVDPNFIPGNEDPSTTYEEGEEEGPCLLYTSPSPRDS